MKLTMTPVGWAGEGSAINFNHAVRYEVQGLPGNEQAVIEGTTTGQGTTWEICRNWQKAEGEYNSPEEALATLEL